MVSTFVAVYRGQTVGEARLLAVSADPKVVGPVLDELLHDDAVEANDDAVLIELSTGRRTALRLAARELEDDSRDGEASPIN